MKSFTLKPFTLVTAILLLGSAFGLTALAQTQGQPMSRPVQRPISSPPPVINLSTLYTAMEPNPNLPVSASPTGGLFVQGKEGEGQVFPLKQTEVKADVVGNVSRVAVTQTFENPFDQPLEAVYVFPLPDEAAVDEMEIRLGDRIIKGDIKRREEAQEIYDRAVSEGRTAGLLEQERDNIFTQSLANIRPGEQIQVTIRYSESLKFEGGNYEFVFPMVVGPRYIPGQPMNRSGETSREMNAGINGDTDQVPDASRITPPVLKPGMRSGHDIGVTVNINAGVPIEGIESTSHKIKIDRALDNPDQVRVQLTEGDTIPNKDLVLRYKVTGRETQATVLSQAGDRGGHFAVYLVPAVDYRPKEIVPKDVVFLMDTSGSQMGAPLAQSKVLMRRFLTGLNPDDTFTIIDFANTATKLSERPLANTAANRAKALKYVEALEANGGTELMNGMNAVMQFPAAPAGRLRSVVLLTDGYIGNDREVIAAVQKQLKPGNRLYSFGVGSSTNRFLLNRLAEVGRGTAQMVRQDENPDPVVERFFNQINRPVLTNVQVTWEGSGPAPSIYPLAAPDLFAQQPLVLFGRKTDAQPGRVKITGTTAGGKPYEQTLAVDFAERENPAIAQLWGRARIKDLMNGLYGNETTEGVEAVTQTALDYRLLSQYTAFVAVSEEVRVDPDGTRRTVQVPVELPEGVSYEGIFGKDAAESANLAGAMPASARLMAPAPSSMAMPRQASGGRRNSSPVTMAKPQILPGAMDQAMDQETVSAEMSTSLSAPKIQVIRSENLDAAAIASLEQHLATLTLPANPAGELTFELRLRRGRVQLVALDAAASTMTDQALIDALRQALQQWQPEPGLSGTVKVTLQVQS